MALGKCLCGAFPRLLRVPYAIGRRMGAAARAKSVVRLALACARCYEGAIAF
jgi:hypothetical protein